MEKFLDDETAESDYVTLVEPPSFEEVNSAMVVSPIEEVTEDWAFNEPDEETRLLIQEALFDKGLYIGKRKGQWGNLTIFAIQEVVSPLDSNGWRATIKPGVPDRELCLLVIKFATERGGYAPQTEDSVAILDQDIWEHFLNGLGEDAK